MTSPTLDEAKPVAYARVRILHVVSSLGMGGQEQVILSLCKELSQRGHTPFVLSLSQGGALRPAFDAFEVHELRHGLGLKRHTFAEVLRIVRAVSPDVVHTHNPSPYFYAAPGSLLTGRRLLHTKHGANLYGKKGLWASRLWARAFDAFVCVSEETREVARNKEWVPEGKLHVIPNGISLSAFARNIPGRERIRHELGLSSEVLVIGSVGRLAPEKNYPLLIAASAPLLHAGAHLILAGEGPARREVSAAIAAHGVASRVHLLGLRRDIADLLSAMDIFALSSDSEGLPVVVAEAMANELPVVATRVGGLPSAVPRDAGILVDKGDRDALRAALHALHDPAMRHAFGARARAWAFSQYDVATMTDRYLALYQGGP